MPPVNVGRYAVSHMSFVPTHADAVGLRREIHDLANQLLVIQGFSGLLGRTVPDDQLAAQYSGEIDLAILRATGSVQRLRRLALALERASADAERQHEVVRCDAGEEERVDAVENTAVAPE